MATPSQIRAGGASVEIRVDGATFQQDLRLAEANLKQWGNRLQAAAPPGGADEFFGGVTGKILRANYIGRAASGAMLATAAAAKALQGDMLGVVDTLSHLPGGFGAVVTATRTMTEAIMEARDHFGRFQKVLADQDRFALGLRNIAVMAGQGAREGLLADAAPQDRERLQAFDYARRAREAVAERAALSGIDMSHAEVQRAFDEIDKELQRRLKKIEEDAGDAAAKVLSDRQTKDEGQAAAARDAAEIAAAWTDVEKVAVRTRQEAAKEGWSPKRYLEILDYRLEEVRQTRLAAEAQAELNDLFAAGEAAAKAMLAAAVEGVEADAARYDEAARVMESVMTPEERAAEEVERLQAMRDDGLIDEDTLARAVRKQVEAVASALPEALVPSMQAKGTLSAFEAVFGGVSQGGVQDRIAAATAATARNTERMVEAAEKLGVTYQP